MLELSFESGETSLSVRRFSARQAVSTLFDVTVEARSPNDDLDLEALVGKGASFRLRGGLAGEPGGRVFRGICCSAEQVRAEPNGLSTYAIHLVPALWLLTQRRNYRVFQHLSVPAIVRAVLAEWRLPAAWKLDEAAHPKLEYRVQYGESDLDFVGRLLEDAGIAFVFPNGDDGPPLLFTDDLGSAVLPVLGPIPFVDDPSTASSEHHLTGVRLAHEVRPTRVTLRDTDFRTSPEHQLVGSAFVGPGGQAGGAGTPGQRGGAAGDNRAEQYHYVPGSFLVETAQGDRARDDTPVADAGGAARHEEKEGRSQAARALDRARSSKRGVAFEGTVDLWPGARFSIAGHPRPDLAADRQLLVTELTLEGTHDGDWTRKGRAAFVGAGSEQASSGAARSSGRAAREAVWLPPLRAPRPRIHGVQTAVVVGPKGQEIHTDEFGRVRVQFPWDREGRFDERSSCWIRVSQGWAGGAYGAISLPRVGQEVLVAFVEGNPDQPIVVGRVFNNSARVPYKLPEHQTVTTWKSASTPGGDGSNEILFEDAKGAERVYVQAERDHERLVKHDETVTIGHDRTEAITADETTTIGGSRTATVADTDLTRVGTRHAVTIGSDAGAATPTGVEIVDRRITFTSGEATITLDGPNITFEAAAAILMKAATDISLEADAHINARANVSLTLASGATLTVRSEGGDLVIQGGPTVRINPETGGTAALSAGGVPLPVAPPAGVDLEQEIAAAESHARFDPAAPSWFDDQLAPGGAWDYARLGPQHAAYASFSYGVMGRAMGFPQGALLRQAGLRNEASGGAKPGWGHPGNGLSGGTYPYGADPHHQELTQKGFAFYDRRFG